MPAEVSGAIFPALGRPDLWQRAAYEFAASQLDHSRAVDFGCGYGWGTALLASRTTGQVIGIDRDEHCIAYAKKHFRSTNLSYLSRDDDHIPVESGSLGLVTAMKVIEHFPPPQLARFLDEVDRTLAPGGRFVGQTPNGELPHTRMVRYIRHVSEAELCRAAQSRNLSIELFGQELAKSQPPGISEKFLAMLPARLARSRPMKVLQGLVMGFQYRNLSVQSARVAVGGFDPTQNLVIVFVMTHQ